MTGEIGLVAMILAHLPIGAVAAFTAILAWVGFTYFRRPEARVKFVVEVNAGPDGKPGGSDVRHFDLCVVGTIAELGFWEHPGLLLEKSGRGRWIGTIACIPGESFEYKITRGNWDREACHSDGSRGENFRLEPLGDIEVIHRISAWCDTVVAPGGGHTLTGNFRFFPEVKSKILGKSRPVIVYLPPGYADSTERYPVIYFHDGNNAFDKATAFGGNEWHVDEVAELLIRAGVIRPFIGIGIYNTFDRENEYTPFPDPMTRSGGGAAGYARFLKEELKPFIDREFQTLVGPGDTGTVGSSLGGLVSLYLGVCHGETFGLIGGVSPSLWWGRGAFGGLIEKAAKKSMARKIWICMGDHEGLGRVRFHSPVGTAGKSAGSDGKSAGPAGKSAGPAGKVTAFKSQSAGGNRLMRGRVGFPDRQWLDRPEPGYPGIEKNRRISALLCEKGYSLGEDLMVCEVIGGRHSEIDWARRIHLILMFLLGKNGFDPRIVPMVEEWQAYFGDDRVGTDGTRWFEARRVSIWRSLFWGRGRN